MKSFFVGAFCLVLLTGALRVTSKKMTTQKSAAVVTKVKGSEKTNCLCQGFISKHSPVCGSDVETYPTACALVEAMKNNSSLGMKCNRACPCPEHPFLDHCTPTMRMSRANMRSAANPKVKAMLKHRSMDPRLIKKYCLTDGTEWNRNTIFCALGSKPGVGIKCMGFCKQCKTINEACPAKMLQNIPFHDEANQ